MIGGSPYKFLDHFDGGDGEYFFARGPETRILVADVVVSRLVVLFAPTGTGKTSLINAGVRPRLEERGYATFFIRVRQDPEQSARAELARAGRGLSADVPLEFSLTELSRRIEQPIVLFFDQFEEFFLYVDEGLRARFIDAIAALHRDRASGVHVVFSMREEFFVEMDAFRERIPTIFHSDSNLRLRPFDRDRAREALVKPAEIAGARIASDVVERVLDDLQHRGWIEPAQLQIVADTLWRRKSGSDIVLQDYLRLGDGTGGNIAHALLGRRLEEQLSGIGNESILKLIERLLPQLVTQPGAGRARTKWVRTVEELARVLAREPAELEEALRPLESLRFIRTIPVSTSGQVLVELTHDYLVDRMEAFQASVRRVWPRRQLTDAMGAFSASGQLMTPETLENVMLVAADLDLSASELQLLFRSGANAGVQARAVFDLAKTRGEDLWPVVEELLGNEDVSVASRAAYLLGKIDDPRVEGLAARSLERHGLAEEVIDALEFAEQPWAVKLIASCADRPGLAAAVRRALMRLARLRDRALADAAAEAVNAHRPQTGLRSLSDAPGWVVRGPTESDEPPYDHILSSFHDGVLVCFVGAGASAGDGESSPPTASQLASVLAGRISVPLDHADATNAQRLASYLNAIEGRSELDQALDDLFRREKFQPREIHRFLAHAPAPLIVVTTNYDDLMEKAFEELQRPFDVIVAPAGGRRGDDWLLAPSDGPSRREPGSRLRFHLESRAVLVKLRGSVGRGETPSSYVITEEDQMEQLSRPGGFGVLPDALREAVTSRSFLFLGHSLRDWSVRQMLQSLGAERRSWAILRGASELDVRLWRSRQVRVFDLDVSEFAQELVKRGGLPAWQPASPPMDDHGDVAGLGDVTGAGGVPDGKRTFVYLSFAKADLEAARRFAAALQAAGVDVFFDPRGVRDFKPVLREIIGKCDLFVALVSKRSTESRDGQTVAELRLALESYETMPQWDPFIIPVIIDDLSAALLPDDLATFRAARAPEGYPTAELVSMIEWVIRGRRRR